MKDRMENRIGGNSSTRVSCRAGHCCGCLETMELDPAKKLQAVLLRTKGTGVYPWLPTHWLLDLLVKGAPHLPVVDFLTLPFSCLEGHSAL